MDQDILKDLLVRLSQGKIKVEEALERLKTMPFEDLGFACIDHHRSLRRGVSEVIFGERKGLADIVAIMERMIEQEENILLSMFFGVWR